MCSEKISPNAVDYPVWWLIASLLWFWLVATLFLFQQSIWTDETTQLTGLTLPPLDLVQWLLGDEYGLGVPADRMPPLSYWYGQLWIAFFGLSINSMRFASLFVASWALILFFHTLYRAFGKHSAILGGLLMASSPNVIAMAVEVRSYALLLFFTVCVLWFIYRILSEKQPLWIYLGLTLASLAAIYTHFYGLIMACAAYLSLLVVLVAAGRSLKPLVISVGVLALGALGLIPFILTAFGHPNVREESPVLYSMFRLAYRFLFHAAMDKVWLVGLSLIGALGLSLGLLRSQSNNFRRVLVGMIGFGLSLVFALALKFTAFEAASPAYNLGLLPPIFALLASSLTDQPLKCRPLMLGPAILLLLAPVYADYQLMTRGKFFSHGRYQEVFEKTIKRYPNVAVLYDRTEEYGMPYFAFYYLSEGSLGQYQIFQADNSQWQVRKITKAGFGRAELLDELDAQYLIVVQLEDQSNRRLQEQINKSVDFLHPKQAVHELLENKNWTLVEHKSYLAFAKIEVFVFEKKTDY